MKFFVIFKKELIEQIRDKRTIVAAVFLPAVIVPLLLFFMTRTAAGGDLQSPVRIALREARPQLEDRISASFTDARFLYAPSLEDSVKGGEAEAGLELQEAEGRITGIVIHYDPSRTVSALAYSRLQSLLAALFAAPSADRVRLTAAAVRGQKESETLLTLSALLPVFLIIFSASSTMSSVIDLSAGEKERGTIETLITCNVERRTIILGKTLAAAGVGFTAVVSLLAGLILGSWILPRITGGLSLAASVGFGKIGMMSVVAALSVLLFAAAGMAIGLYAKSVKEGTILTLPVIILGSALSSGFVGADPFSIDPVFYFVPILNLACIVRTLIFARIDVLAFLIAAASNLCYASLFLLLSNHLLKKETVICRS